MEDLRADQGQDPGTVRSANFAHVLSPELTDTVGLFHGSNGDG